jgi:uncharacterized protein (TIGR02145 family)
LYAIYCSNIINGARKYKKKFYVLVKNNRTIINHILIERGTMPSDTEKQILAKALPAKIPKKPTAAVTPVPGVETQFTDPRDGNVCRTVKIGNQVWMAENIRYKIDGSWCYDDDESNSQRYGRLYNWEAAKEACPPGWHLPTRKEWQRLFGYAGGNSVASRKLKSTRGWNDYKSQNCNGTDDFGFSALPGGCRDTKGSFYGVGNCGDWWTATASGSGCARRRNMLYNHVSMGEGDHEVGNGFSVRCVQD